MRFVTRFVSTAPKAQLKPTTKHRHSRFDIDNLDCCGENDNEKVWRGERHSRGCSIKEESLAVIKLLDRLLGMAESFTHAPDVSCWLRCGQCLVVVVLL